MADWEDLKTRLLAGDDDAVWTDLRRSLREMIGRLDGSPDRERQVQDILHDVIISLVKCRRTGYLGQIRSLGSYVAAIAIRRRTRSAWCTAEEAVEDVEALSPTGDATPGPLELLLETELRHHIQAAIDGLQRTQREVILLHLREGMNVPEICRHLGESGRPRSRQSVTSLLKRARKSLRKTIFDKFLRTEAD